MRGISKKIGKHTTSQEKKALTLEPETSLDFIWRMNFRSEVPLYANVRPIEAMVWINEIESATSTADLKTPKTITRAKLQTNFEVLDSKECSQEDHQRRLQKKGLRSRRSCKKKKNAFSLEGKSHG